VILTVVLNTGVGPRQQVPSQYYTIRVPGVDGMTVEQLPGFLKRHWPKIKQALLDGYYYPFPVRKKDIPKPDGGTRPLGIPTVLDRLIQQAIAQVLQRI